MAPEALTASSPVSPGSDIWSLGACAFAAMTGKVPFDGDAIGDIVLKVCAAPLPVPSVVRPGVPPGFDVWFAKACQRDPARRFASMPEMSAALRQLDRMQGRGDLEYPVPNSPTAAVGARRPAGARARRLEPHTNDGRVVLEPRSP